MINFARVDFNRLIMHEIKPKKDGMDSAFPEYEDQITVINEDVSDIIRMRLTNAAGKNSKAFELQIENSSPGSFFKICDGLSRKSDNDFIRATQMIADLMASSQRKANIPGGILLVIDGQNLTNNNSVYVAIKAEPHEALQKRGSALEVLKEVFLSPSQKLYKLGVLYEKDRNPAAEPNTRYGCFIFDDQFRPDYQPAEYFYKDFLGFTISSNAKIQSKRFYDKTEAFIKRHFNNYEQKNRLLAALKLEFSTNQNPTITPYTFGETYFQELIDEYENEVVEELPPTITKDPVLISNKMTKRKMNFPNDINITGPDENFDKVVDVINDGQSFANLNPTDHTYTILRIKGQPYSNE